LRRARRRAHRRRSAAHGQRLPRQRRRQRTAERRGRGAGRMTRVLRLAAGLAIAALLLQPAGLAADITIPYLTGRVVDDANILRQGARDRITAASKAHEQQTSDQVVVLTVPSLGGASIEEFAVKVFEAWKLGQKDKANGVLIVVAPQEHRMRI